MPHDLPHLPQLLVSVRTPQEALDALSGGAGILDIKEPSHGPLGMAGLVDMATDLRGCPIGLTRRH